MNENDTKIFNKNIDEIISKLEYYELENRIILLTYKYYSQIGLFGKAEDKLYQLLENNYEIIEEINNFYKMLLKKDDTELENGNLTRNEIIEAMEKIINKTV